MQSSCKQITPLVMDRRSSVQSSGIHTVYCVLTLNFPDRLPAQLSKAIIDTSEYVREIHNHGRDRVERLHLLRYTGGVGSTRDHTVSVCISGSAGSATSKALVFIMDSIAKRDIVAGGPVVSKDLCVLSTNEVELTKLNMKGVNMYSRFSIVNIGPATLSALNIVNSQDANSAGIRLQAIEPLGTVHCSFVSSISLTFELDPGEETKVLLWCPGTRWDIQKTNPPIWKKR